MSCCLHVRPCTDRLTRARRVQWLGFTLLGLTVLAVWNPLSHPGPRLCLLRHAVALPCPLCGLTRGLALSLRGRLVEAFTLNPLALPVLVLVVVLALRWLIEITFSVHLTLRPPRWLARTLVVLGNLALLAGWAYLLVYRREDAFASSWLGRLLN